jgi:hypothetical protein
MPDPDETATKPSGTAGPAMKFFNTARLCRPEDHYMLPALSRLPEMRELIDQIED